MLMTLLPPPPTRRDLVSYCKTYVLPVGVDVEGVIVSGGFLFNALSCHGITVLLDRRGDVELTVLGYGSAGTTADSMQGNIVSEQPPKPPSTEEKLDTDCNKMDVEINVVIEDEAVGAKSRSTLEEPGALLTVIAEVHILLQPGHYDLLYLKHDLDFGLDSDRSSTGRAASISGLVAKGEKERVKLEVIRREEEKRKKALEDERRYQALLSEEAERRRLAASGGRNRPKQNVAGNNDQVRPSRESVKNPMHRPDEPNLQYNDVKDESKQSLLQQRGQAGQQRGDKESEAYGYDEGVKPPVMKSEEAHKSQMQENVQHEPSAEKTPSSQDPSVKVLPPQDPSMKIQAPQDPSKKMQPFEDPSVKIELPLEQQSEQTVIIRDIADLQPKHRKRFILCGFPDSLYKKGVLKLTQSDSCMLAIDHNIDYCKIFQFQRKLVLSEPLNTLLQRSEEIFPSTQYKGNSIYTVGREKERRECNNLMPLDAFLHKVLGVEPPESDSWIVDAYNSNQQGQRRRAGNNAGAELDWLESAPDQLPLVIINSDIKTIWVNMRISAVLRDDASIDVGDQTLWHLVTIDISALPRDGKGWYDVHDVGTLLWNTMGQKPISYDLCRWDIVIYDFWKRQYNHIFNACRLEMVLRNIDILSDVPSAITSNEIAPKNNANNNSNNLKPTIEKSNILSDPPTPAPVPASAPAPPSAPAPASTPAPRPLSSEAPRSNHRRDGSEAMEVDGGGCDNGKDGVANTTSTVPRFCHQCHVFQIHADTIPCCVSNHILCEPCIDEHLLQTAERNGWTSVFYFPCSFSNVTNAEDKPSLRPIFCPIDGCGDIINGESLSHDAFRLWTSKLFKEYADYRSNVPCDFCTNNAVRNESVVLGCGHVSHPQCLQKAFQRYIKNGNWSQMLPFGCAVCTRQSIRCNCPDCYLRGGETNPFCFHVIMQNELMTMLMKLQKSELIDDNIIKQWENHNKRIRWVDVSVLGGRVIRRCCCSHKKGEIRLLPNTDTVGACNLCKNQYCIKVRLFVCML